MRAGAGAQEVRRLKCASLSCNMSRRTYRTWKRKAANLLAERGVLFTYVLKANQ